jgi:hypothetical protein
MTLVKMGHLTEEYWYGECVICNAIFQSTRKELEARIIDPEDSSFSEFAILDCPYCKHPRGITFFKKSSKMGIELYKKIPF